MLPLLPLDFRCGPRLCKIYITFVLDIPKYSAWDITLHFKHCTRGGSGKILDQV
jgi:hypothetical protein